MTGVQTCALPICNYNSYAPTLTGTGASGTWGINISGNAATATSATSATTATTVSTTVSSGATGTTQSNNDNSTKISTTAYVQNMAIGWGQTWTNVTSSRALSTTYTNSTGKPIQIAVGLNGGAPDAFSYQVIIDGNTVISTGSDHGMTLTFIIPSGSTYRIQSSDSLGSWWELR